jgi:hypothetical protein
MYKVAMVFRTTNLEATYISSIISIVITPSNMLLTSITVSNGGVLPFYRAATISISISISNSKFFLYKGMGIHTVSR